MTDHRAWAWPLLLLALFYSAPAVAMPVPPNYLSAIRQHCDGERRAFLSTALAAGPNNASYVFGERNADFEEFWGGQDGESIANFDESISHLDSDVRNATDPVSRDFNNLHLCLWRTAREIRVKELAGARGGQQGEGAQQPRQALNNTPEGNSAPKNGQSETGGEKTIPADPKKSAANDAPAKQAVAKQAVVKQIGDSKIIQGEPAHGCIRMLKGKEAGSFGGFQNDCGFEVFVFFCAYQPKKGAWNENLDCEKSTGGFENIGANRRQAVHTNGSHMYWFACKGPAWPKDTRFQKGSGILGRCG